jgi:hypothetical protein
MYDNTGTKKRAKKVGTVNMTKKIKKKDKRNDKKNRKMNSRMGNIMIGKEEMRKVKNKGKEMRCKRNKKETKKYKQTNACYETMNNTVRKKKTGRTGKRRKKSKRIKNAIVKECKTKKGERINSICKYGMYGMYSTQGTRNRSADRPPAIRYTKENNKHRPACTQKQYTVQAQLRRKYGANTSCRPHKTICETKYVIYGTKRAKGKIDNGIWCKCWNGISRFSNSIISKTLQVNWKLITESYISNMENVKGAPVDPDYNLQYPILGQRKGNKNTIPLMWSYRKCSTKWNRWSNRYRE